MEIVILAVAVVALIAGVVAVLCCVADAVERHWGLGE